MCRKGWLALGIAGVAAVAAVVFFSIGWLFVNPVAALRPAFRGDRLTVTRIGGFAHWTRTVTDHRLVRAVGDAIAALPLAPRGPTSCPADFGVVYRLTFRRNQQTILTALAGAGGCEGLSVDGHALWTMQSRFWAVLARAVGMPQETLHVGGAIPLAGGSALAFWTKFKGLVAVGSAETWVAETQNGGKTWFPTFATVQPLLSIGVGPGNGAWIATGNCKDGTCSAELYRSRDGGRSWGFIRTLLRIPKGFLSGGFGWAMTPERSPAWSTTHDGGATWQELSNPCPRLAPQPDLLSFASPQEGYLACVRPGAGRAELLRSTDGGARWSQIGALPLDGQTPVEIAIRPSGNGWVVGASGSLAVTSDGGGTWSDYSLHSPPNAKVVSADLVASGMGYALLNDKVTGYFALLKSDDLGATWNNVGSWPRNWPYSDSTKATP